MLKPSRATKTAIPAIPAIKREALGFDQVHVGDHNYAAVDVLKTILINSESYLPIIFFWIYGEGGVGKTTLLKAFYNEASKGKLFKEIGFFNAEIFKAQLANSDDFENFEKYKFIVVDDFEEINHKNEVLDKFMEFLKGKNIRLIFSSSDCGRENLMENYPCIQKNQNITLSLNLSTPELDDLKQILKIVFKNLNIQIGEDSFVIISYLLLRSSIDCLGDIFDKLSKYAPESLEDVDVLKIVETKIETYRRRCRLDLRDTRNFVLKKREHSN